MNCASCDGWAGTCMAACPLLLRPWRPTALPRRRRSQRLCSVGAPTTLACLELMRDAFRSIKSVASSLLAVLDDRRNGGLPRVAAIVSLYNAAGKLPTLLATLQRQSLARRGELEVVLVDSASPTDERGVFES